MKTLEYKNKSGSTNYLIFAGTTLVVTTRERVCVSIYNLHEVVGVSDYVPPTGPAVVEGVRLIYNDRYHTDFMVSADSLISLSNFLAFVVLEARANAARISVASIRGTTDQYMEWNNFILDELEKLMKGEAGAAKG